MTTTTSTVFDILHVVFWVVFIGLCIKAGAILFSFGISLFGNPAGGNSLFDGLKLAKLFAFSKWHYISVVSLLIAITGLKAYMAYLVILIFSKFSLSKPFNPAVTDLISKISYNALETGILAVIGSAYCKWLINRDFTISIDWGAEEILFFAGVIYILAKVFEKGTELQNENDLTV